MEHGNNINKLLDPRRLNYSEMHRTLDNRNEAIKAGNFLKASGISNAVIDFRQGFLGEMGDLRNDLKIEKTGSSSSASIILEWIDPDDLRHLILKVSAGRSDRKERYLSASFNEVRHYKWKKGDPRMLKISMLPLGRGFSFDSPVSRRQKMRYKRWLRENILNYEFVWGDNYL